MVRVIDFEATIDTFAGVRGSRYALITDIQNNERRN